MFTIYVVDRANQILSFAYPSQDEADAAADRWESIGADVYKDRIKAVLAKDEFDRRMRAQLVR